MGRNEEVGGFSIDLGDNTKVVVFGWIALALAVAIGVSVVMLTTALSTSLLILSGAGGGGLFVFSVGKAAASIIDAKARRDYLQLRGTAEILAARKNGRLPTHPDYQLLRGRGQNRD